jgi:2-keto-4-pentenoate hydratase/2-oxohepta-3-ene-1,7-dioic acid hydratase in catechol pathway
MRIIRFLSPSGSIHHAAEQSDGSALLIQGDILGTYEVTAQKAEVKQLLAPIEPRAILCVGLNYRKHAEEFGQKVPDYPVLFLKSPGAVNHPGAAIELPSQLKSDSVDYECELAVVIRKKAKNVSVENALSYVLGYTAANDVSARDWQKNAGGGQWCRGKTFDTFCPLGPALITADELGNPNTLQIKTVLNGRTVQDCNTSDMIFSVAEIISFLSASTTLLPGTVILTGTPHGIGMAHKPPLWLKVGDTVVVEIEKIGQLVNTVTQEIL